MTPPLSGWARTVARLAIGVFMLSVVLLAAASCAASTEAAVDPSAPPTATPGPTPTATPPPGREAQNNAAEEADDNEAAQPVVTGTATAPSTGPMGATPVSNPAQFATIAETACRFEQPSAARADCFDLIVPENWDTPTSGPTVTLHVARFRARAANASPDPVVYLEGGPGGHALAPLAFSYPALFKEFTTTRDVIVFDQRGAGLSEPALDCPGITEVTFAQVTSNISPEAVAASSIEAVEQCREDLLQENIDLSRYNSVSSAADLEAMRTLLEVEEWNLYSISYGTRLAQTAMRLYPDGIRSAVLDSILPTNADMAAVFVPNAKRSDSSCSSTRSMLSPHHSPA